MSNSNEGCSDRLEGPASPPRAEFRHLRPGALPLLAALFLLAPEFDAAERAASKVAPPSRTAPSLLRDVKATREGGKLVVAIVSEGPIAHQDFVLPNPPRLVMDLHNVENRIPFATLPFTEGQVKQLRVRQFQATDPKITRMVFDLADENSRYDVLTDGGSLRVVFHDVAASAPPRAIPKADTAPTTPRAAPPPAPAAKNAAQPASVDSAATPVQSAPAPIVAREPSRSAPPAAAVTAPAPERTTAVPETARSQAEPKSAPAAPIVNDLAASEIPLSALEATMTEVRVRPAAPARKAPAPATQQPPLPAPLPPATPAPGATQRIEPSRQVNIMADSRFSGHPLTLDLVDVSLVDFFRLMAEEGGINIVMDPEIKGTISIKVVKVPWDQIFEAALLNNGLDKKVEGNLVRIARKQTLQDEAKQQEALNKANLLAAEIVTRIKRLNYAKATTFIGPLSDQKTARGTVVVDERTNTLIITDIPASVDKMIDLVDALDVPQQQVEIEARIVSATRDFARDIGVQFGFVQGNLERVSIGGPNTFGTIGGSRPSATPSSTFVAGNTITGRGAANSTASEAGSVSAGEGGNYNVNLPATKRFGGVGLSIGNIFDTFLLDAAITAGETKGLAKLISQPKVTAQNNQQAIVTQGFRFPVQIVANNTVTIQFQNAALTLTVTPQITMEGNVVLDLSVENNTPDFGRQVNGVPSIRTSESKTRVLVSDGGTTVIGGILIEKETTSDDRVPGLASLPVIGNLFRRSSVTRSVEEVLFFITPRIMK